MIQGVWGDQGGGVASGPAKERRVRCMTWQQRQQRPLVLLVLLVVLLVVLV